jgi:hypothetical protein
LINGLRWFCSHDWLGFEVASGLMVAVKNFFNVSKVALNHDMSIDNVGLWSECWRVVARAKMDIWSCWSNDLFELESVSDCSITVGDK